MHQVVNRESEMLILYFCCRLPFWSYSKLFFNCWLVLPWFNGAAYVYDHFVRPMFVNRQIVNIWYVPRKEKLSKSDDVLSAAERYIQQNGTEAIERLISKVSLCSTYIIILV
jgi:receptor expression-enhancing protein 5/6